MVEAGRSIFVVGVKKRGLVRGVKKGVLEISAVDVKK
jgi:hypothetical protein